MSNSKLEKFLEDFILFYLIIAKIMQFLGIITIFENIGLYIEFFEFIDIIVSMTGLGYVLYKSSLSEIFYGEKKKTFDFLVIIFYFLLITNKFLEFNYVIASKGICNYSERFLSPLICYIANPLNYNSIISITFLISSFGLVLLSIYSTFYININEKSVLNALHEDNKTNKIIKFISSFLVIFGFYLIFFNFISEWFTRILDAPIILIALLFYIFKFHNKIQQAETILFKVGESVEDIVNGFINLFHNKKTLFLGISLILVLHLITDLTTYIIPYNLGIGKNYIIESMEDKNHLSIIEHYNEDLKKGINPILLFLGYSLNTIGVFYLMFFPLFIWFIIYDNITSKKQRTFPNFLIALFYFSLIFMQFMPTYSITSLDNQNIIGTDIKTHSILSTGNNLNLILILSFIFFLIILFLLKYQIIKDILFFILCIITLGFFGIYVYYYYMSLLNFFIYSITILSKSISFIKIYIIFFYFLFALLLSIFYLGSYLSFLIYTFKED